MHSCPSSAEQKVFQVYGKDGIDLVVVQQRSPALKVSRPGASIYLDLNSSLKSRKQEFIDALLEFIQNSGVTSVLFLSGVDLSNRTDAQMLYVSRYPVILYPLLTRNVLELQHTTYIP